MFDAQALTPTSSAVLIGNLKYLTFAGPAETETRDAFNQDVTVTLGKKEKSTSYNFSASYRRSEITTVQLEETGFATLRGSVIVTIVGGGLKHELGPIDTIAWSTNYSSTDFTLQNGTPSAILTSTLDWTHRVSPIIAVTPSLQYQLLTYGDASQTEVMFWKAMMGMNTELTKRLSFQAAAGGTLLSSEQNNVMSGPIPIAQTSGSNLGWLANAQLTYRPFKTVKVFVTAARTVAPTILGEFVNSDSLSLALNYDINQVSSLSLSGSITQQTAAKGGASVPGGLSATGGSSEFLTAAIAYSRQLAREWRTNLSYRHVHRNSDIGVARSNSIVLVMTRDATIVP